MNRGRGTLQTSAGDFTENRKIFPNGLRHLADLAQFVLEERRLQSDFASSTRFHGG